MQHEITMTEAGTGAHVATHHAHSHAFLRDACVNAAMEACRRANHASNDPLKPNHADIVSSLLAGISVRVWHSDHAQASHGIGTDISVRSYTCEHDRCAQVSA